jgi:hypothetical protein
VSRRNGSRGCRRVRSGDWACACGQRYRVLAADGVVWIWPKNCAEGYRVEPIGAECVCGLAITRGAVLSGLFGASVLGTAAQG